MTTHDRDKIIAIAEEVKANNDMFGDFSVALYAIAFEAGAASRDAEVAELVGVLGNVTAHLVAAHSLLSRGGKKAAASDTVFKIMLQDYEKSFEAGRKALAKVRKP